MLTPMSVSFGYLGAVYVLFGPEEGSEHEL